MTMLSAFRSFGFFSSAACAATTSGAGADSAIGAAAAAMSSLRGVENLLSPSPRSAKNATAATSQPDRGASARGDRNLVLRDRRVGLSQHVGRRLDERFPLCGELGRVELVAIRVELLELVEEDCLPRFELARAIGDRDRRLALEPA